MIFLVPSNKHLYFPSLPVTVASRLWTHPSWARVAAGSRLVNTGAERVSAGSLSAKR